MRELLTIAETAGYLRYNQRYFRENYRLIGIPFIKLPTGKVLFDKRELDKWVGTFEIGSLSN